ncbi:YegS/Rv2252/BmrU family lipid kinase [Microbacterium oxydans]|uniref:Diacylglycerol kinase n=1 Tax=Microbacterium oxydans TaxID=82380 RepID=A0A0F0L6A9_9MICO|nr:YegS/Rv2252/BmrU family lipid kinase [Microbacterium oxydans]KJL27845.1 Diacylglycerol kinase [Microbacterium oxydans]
MGEHIAVLANPHAGKGRGAHAAAAAVEGLRAAGVDVRAYAGESPEDTARLAMQALSEEPAALVVVGGDGTLSGILELLIRNTVPVALVAAGTGNDLARALDLPRDDPGAAALLAVRGTPRSIDVGEVRSDIGTRLFLTVAALGFDAKVSDRTNRLRWPRGVLRYYLALLIELARLRPMAFRLSVDEESPWDAPGTLIAVGNTASYGGGMPVCVGAEADDGLLDVVHVRPIGRLRLILLFPSLLRARHLERREVAHRRARSVTVSAPGLVVYADGELVGAGTATISLRPAAITVLVPSEA